MDVHGKPETWLLGVEGLQVLLDVLNDAGYAVRGPVVRDGTVVLGPVSRTSDLPIGLRDVQDAGTYRLESRGDDRVFGFATGMGSAKSVFFPTEHVLWRGRRDDTGFSVEPATEDPEAPYALIGVRSCDLAAVGVQDTVLAGRRFADDSYVARRAEAFVVAVTCSDPGGTCFCVSMGTGPRPSPERGAAYDLGLTELHEVDDEGHRLLVEVTSERGAQVLEQVAARLGGGSLRPARDLDTAAADEVAGRAAGRMGRTLDTAGLKDLLYAAADSPVWDDVAQRCLSCTNCTAVCPTCFCTDVHDVTDLTGDALARTRVWDSCFTTDYSYLHGGSVRSSSRSRYRQWMTHKLASWIDQFGTSGCVGCGRCVTWCPVGIDLTEEAARIREASGDDGTAVRR